VFLVVWLDIEKDLKKSIGNINFISDLFERHILVQLGTFFGVNFKVGI
jgi:hypothetical protein